MAKVKMSQYTDDQYTQETYEFVYEYMYCDKCGSFDIGHLSKLPSGIETVLLYIAFGSIPVVIGILVFFDFQWRLGCPVGLIGLIAFALASWTTHLECNKCGNSQFTSKNVLNYPENDRSVLDVPEKSITKTQIETKTYR